MGHTEDQCLEERALARLVLAGQSPSSVLSSNDDVWSDSTTINDAIAAWEENGWQNLSPWTIRRYLSIWKTHIEPLIGRRRISDLGRYDFELFFRQLKAGGQSEASVRQIKAVLRHACRLARKWSRNSLPNPVSESELPEWSIATKARKIRSPELTEVRALLRAAEALNERFRATMPPRLSGFAPLTAA